MVLAKVLPRDKSPSPKKIRERLGIKEGDIISLEEVEDSVMLKKGKTLFDVAGTIEIERDVSLRDLIEEAREGEDFKSHRQ